MAKFSKPLQFACSVGCWMFIPVVLRRLQQPHSQRHQADLRLTGQIKQFWLESGCVYGYRKIHLDLRDSGQQCGVNRVWRLMKRVGIKAQVGYRSPRARKGEASIVSPNRLQRQFNPDAPDERWVTDITYIRTHEGWLYLAVVVDLFSRKIIGWSMQSRMTKDIVLNALLMAVWRRNPQNRCWFIRIRAVSTQAMSGSRS
nr:Integrase core domain [Klebsiella pneumoniae]